MPLRILVLATAALLPPTAPPLAAGEAPAPSAEIDLLREALVAARPGDAPSVESERAEVLEALSEIVERVGPGRPSYRRAERLHRLIHRDYLRRYREDADGLHGLVDRGEYNCVSATLFHGLAARELGYAARVVELPGHLMLELDVAGRWIRVETTAVRGFDREGGFAVPPSAEGRGPTHLLAPGPGRSGSGEPYRRVLLEEAVGVVWLNSAWRALDRGETVRAAAAVARSRRFLSGEPTDDDARRVFSQAFRAEYESGDFVDAYRIAGIEVQEFADLTTPRDRLFAAAVKRVENACDDDDPRLASAIAEEVARLTGANRETGRFERRAWPVIAAAAVRLGDWELALRAADRYGRVEPDPVEALRVVDWVAARMQDDLPGAAPGACEEAEAASATPPSP